MAIQGSDWQAVQAFRQAERRRLIDWRMSLSVAERADRSARIMDGLTRTVTARPGLVVSGYMPYRGEPDVRPWLSDLASSGVTTCLPVVTARHAPLIFRSWTPGCRMERGALGILAPADGDIVLPDIIIAPLVGFDSDFYRLGHGGGYFDRTLAALKPRAILVIGVGYDHTRLETIFPQAFDIPMDMIITESVLLGGGHRR
jgi:5-formyltetrahydrofolate cyclo-ligase